MRTPIAGNGIDLIAAERQRQIEAEGWTPEHDAEHTDDNSLVWAARCYISAAIFPTVFHQPPTMWPWKPEDWKPSRGDDTIRDLVKAGALIAAEIDRLSAARGRVLTTTKSSLKQPFE